MNGNGHSRSAAHFRRTETLVLNSGLEVEVQRPNISTLVMENSDTGNIPEPLVAQVTEGLTEAKAGKKKTPSGWTPSRTDLPAIAKYMALIIRAALVWPKVVEQNPDYDAGEILLSDLHQTEQEQIFSWAQPEAAAAAQRFRQQQNKVVESVSTVPGVSSETE